MSKWSFFGLLLIGIACLEPPDCLKSSGNVVKAEFRKLDGTLDTVAIKSIEVEGQDSVFYKQYGNDVNDTLSSVLFEIRPFQSDTITAFFYLPDDTLNLILSYRVNSRFISEDCGADQVISELKIVSTEFDSVRVVNNQIANDPSTNLYIYK